MNTKVAVVTGSNKGIGFAIVRGLCKRFDGVVYLTSRNEKRGNDAVAALNKEGLYPHYHQLDITNAQSVTNFHDYIQEKYGNIDILVNNAAIAFKEDTDTVLTAAQTEETLKVNYFGVLSTCEILFPLLRNGARVINVSSSRGHLSRIPSKNLRERFQDPNLTISELTDIMRQYLEAVKQGTQVAEWGYSPYSVSKVGLTALTKIQQRLLNDRDIKVNAVHPGYVNTDITSRQGPLSIDEGAQAPLYLALDAPDSVKGEYVWYDKRIVSWTEVIPGENY